MLGKKKGKCPAESKNLLSSWVSFEYTPNDSPPGRLPCVTLKSPKLLHCFIADDEWLNFSDYKWIVAGMRCGFIYQNSV